jgi:hypothetical protein
VRILQFEQVDSVRKVHNYTLSKFIREEEEVSRELILSMDKLSDKIDTGKKEEEKPSNLISLYDDKYYSYEEIEFRYRIISDYFYRKYKDNNDCEAYIYFEIFIAVVLFINRNKKTLRQNKLLIKRGDRVKISRLLVIFLIDELNSMFMPEVFRIDITYFNNFLPLKNMQYIDYHFLEINLFIKFC